MMTAEQLKASILQMAMQGKLVEQRAEEGTGEDLIGNISKTNHFKPIKYTDISEIEKEYDIPGSWAWVQLENIATLYNGRAYKQSELLDTGKTPVLRVGNLFTSDKWYYSDLELDDNKYCESEDLLYSWSASFGPFIWRGGKVIYHYHIWKVEYTPDICRDYLYYYLLTETQRIKVNGHGLAMIHVTKAGMEKILVPLPPLEEQNRIVAKIEELMPFVEQYAKAFTRLNTLNASFPDQMKKSILQQAVMGKLVPQDPNDEPASVLLKKIAEEKQKLIKDGKIKKQKTLPIITEEEIPFDIPESWKWAQLDELVIFENGDRGKNYPNKSEYVRSGVAWINTGHIKPNGYLTTSEMNYITREKFESLRSGKIEANDLVFCLRGATYGKVSRVEPYTEGAVASSLMIIRPIISILRDYLLLYLKTPLALSELVKYANGSAQPNLGAKDVRKYLVPLPPLKEQKRILECVEEILPKLDDLRK